MGGNELEVLEHYNRKLQKYGDCKDAGEILLKCLSKLDQVRVNIALLSQTGIGKTVSALKKKYGDSEIGTISRDLVNKWKDIVAREENEDEQNNSEDIDEEEAPDINKHNFNEPPSYVPTPISQGYTPTPLYELTSNSTAETEKTVNGVDEHPSIKHTEDQRENSHETDSHHHKSKKKKSHREDRVKESSSSSKSSRSLDTEKDKNRSHHKHKNVEQDRDSKRLDHEKGRPRDHKSSKSSHRDKDKDSESDYKRSDKEKHRSKDKDSSKHKSKDDGKSNENESKNCISKKDASSSSSLSSSQGHSKSSKSKDKIRSDNVKKPKELATVDIFSMNADCSANESNSRKRHREEKDDQNKSKKSKSSSSDKFVLPIPPSSFPPIPSGPSLIPEISPVYKPLPRLPMHSVDRVVEDKNTDEESLSMLLSNKNKNRTAIYSGTKRKGYFGSVPSLYDQCIQILKDHVDKIDEVGNLGYDILKPILERASPETLMHIEDYNPYLMEDTSELWEKIVRKDFRNKEREECESWREMFERCTVERAEKFEALKGKMKQTSKAEEDQHKKTKLAYVDIAPKAPRNIRNAQAKHGTALPVGHSMVAGGARPRSQIGDPTANASRAGLVSKKPRVAPMMAKTMKLMKGIKGGFRR